MDCGDEVEHAPERPLLCQLTRSVGQLALQSSLKCLRHYSTGVSGHCVGEGGIRGEWAWLAVTGDRGHLTVLADYLRGDEVRGVLYKHRVNPLKQQVGEQYHAHGGPGRHNEVISVGGHDSVLVQGVLVPGDRGAVFLGEEGCHDIKELAISTSWAIVHKPLRQLIALWGD